MIALAPGQAAPALRALCPPEGHTYRRCFAVLDGSAGGSILTDDQVAPSWAAVQEHSDDGTVYLVGSLRSDLVAGAIGVLRRERMVSVALRLNDPLDGLLPPGPDDDRVEIDFEDRDPAVDLEQLGSPPAGLLLVRIDEGLLPRCAWAPWMVRSVEAALELGLGYCLLDGETVVAEAFAGPVVEGALEMATIADAAYRRRGLATVVCARTILECERLGYRTWWNTGLGNVASVGLARKLGYRTERHYRVLAWSKSPAA